MEHVGHRLSHGGCEHSGKSGLIDVGRGRIGRWRHRQYRVASTICLFLTGTPVMPLLSGLFETGHTARLPALASHSSTASFPGFVRSVSQTKYGDFIWKAGTTSRLQCKFMLSNPALRGVLSQEVLA